MLGASPGSAARDVLGVKHAKIKIALFFVKYRFSNFKFLTDSCEPLPRKLRRAYPPLLGVILRVSKNAIPLLIPLTSMALPDAWDVVLFRPVSGSEPSERNANRTTP